MDEEKEPVWRDIWQEIIEASGKDLQNENNDLRELQKIEEKYPNDKMILFEKAIAYEVLGNRDNAIKFYKEAADDKSGLPVKHWRKRAKYFYEYLENNVCHPFGDLNINQSFENNQLDTYFNIHSYCYLNTYIRYLAISSVSRLHSEPAMAIVIFRTCLETGLWTYFEKDVESINENYKETQKDGYDINLDNLLKQMNNKGLFTIKDEYDVYKYIKKEGNKAAHPGKIKEIGKPFKYSDSELNTILLNFNKMLRILNSRAKNASLSSRK